jgi:tRNA(His) guanylyltransferase
MNLGDRIKKYEKAFHYTTVPRMPVMIRVDGKAFHTLTRNMNKPFDSKLIATMINSAIYTATRMQGFKVAYIQSDEVSFCLTDYDNLDTQGWFDYDLAKMVSISAAMMSVGFNSFMSTAQSYTESIPIFDSRAFTVPISDIVNAFLWRAKDWERNSLQMYCRSLFSHKELNGKKRSDMHEMLHKINKNWTTDLPERERNGTFLIRRDGNLEIRTDILPSYQSINDAIGSFFIESKPQ